MLLPAQTLPLASYAVSEENSRGRQYPVSVARDRTAFERDYGRIIHSQAFRRLQGKTQVFSFVNEDDRCRTRMSHSLEVAQLSVSGCAQLRLNEALAAALAVGHDLGHAPFGHLGQDVLNELMAEHGGFEHNHQALRLVDVLESPYLEHRGLNLMFETREGLLKHCSRERALRLGEVARRHLDGSSPPLEVQMVDVMDAIAYIHADLEDAFVMGLLTPEDLLEAPGYRQAWESFSSRTFGDKSRVKPPASSDFEDSDPEKQRYARALVLTILREMITAASADVITATRRRIESANPVNLDAVRRCPPLVGFSQAAYEQHLALKRFSRERIYSHPTVVDVRAKERKILEDLFRAYITDPKEMSGRGPEKGEDSYRVVADHIARMTDRCAYREHRRLLEARPDLVRETVLKRGRVGP